MIRHNALNRPVSALISLAPTGRQAIYRVTGYCALWTLDAALLEPARGTRPARRSLNPTQCPYNDTLLLQQRLPRHRYIKGQLAA